MRLNLDTATPLEVFWYWTLTEDSRSRFAELLSVAISKHLEYSDDLLISPEQAFQAKRAAAHCQDVRALVYRSEPEKINNSEILTKAALSVFPYSSQVVTAILSRWDGGTLVDKRQIRGSDKVSPYGGFPSICVVDGECVYAYTREQVLEALDQWEERNETK